jgi:hypothetical protein
MPAQLIIHKEEHFLAFDEALERYGVKFVKQNIGGNPIDQAQLELQIQSFQAEKERLELLLSEYLDDDNLITRSGSVRALQSRDHVVWHLSNKRRKLSVLKTTSNINYLSQQLHQK